MTTTLATMTNADPRFYTLLGPYLARRDVHRQVGGPIYDDDNKTWIIATDNGAVTGFIGIRSQGGVVAESCYLVDENDTDLLALLIRAALACVAPTPVRATVRHARAAVYTSAGFTEAGRTNGFAKLVHPGTTPSPTPAT
ncbi:hypothetical protein [Sphaerisporangium aureirubrum]|uniref:N-acetyltransferase domain-containing protein n=1 Tax=Sphaerisporangium aureirubrum TaxID=1544736 RepID=A0ABW1NED2_9ACTN